MKRYADEEIVRYAERRVKDSRARGLVLAIMGGLALLGFLGLVWFSLEKSRAGVVALIGDDHFWIGIWLFAGPLCVVNMFRLNRGIEAQAYKLLVKLAKERRDRLAAR